MTGGEALNELALRGVRVRVDGQQLLVGPRHAITAEVRKIIQEHREPIFWAVHGFLTAHNVPAGLGRAAPPPAPAPASEPPKPPAPPYGSLIPKSRHEYAAEKGRAFLDRRPSSEAKTEKRSLAQVDRTWR